MSPRRAPQAAVPWWWTGASLLCAGLAAHGPWIARWLSPDGTLEPTTAGRLWVVRWALLGLGAVLLPATALRRRLGWLSIPIVLGALWVAMVQDFPASLLQRPSAAIQAVLKPELLLRQFEPRAMLVVPATEIARAKFPVLNIHAHFRTGEERRTAEDMVQIMDACNVRGTVDLDGRSGDELRTELALYAQPHPERFIMFTGVGFGPTIDWPAWMRQVQWLEEAKQLGARGIKIWKYLGLITREANGQRLAVDDPRLDPMWAAAGRLGLPILIHLGDPDAFFEPVDAHNERYEEIVYFNPGWSFADPKYPRPAQILAEFERVLERHPKTRFIGAHLLHAEDLAVVSGLLDRHPNLFVDLSARANELGRQPVTARAFLIRYAARVLFGTDGNPDAHRYRGYFRLLETADEYFPYPRRPGYNQGRWQVHGLDLPDHVLRRIYYDNAARLLGLPPLAEQQKRGLP